MTMLELSATATEDCSSSRMERLGKAVAPKPNVSLKVSWLLPCNT